jgi:hypothetical protein
MKQGEMAVELRMSAEQVSRGTLLTLKVLMPLKC